MTDQSISTQSTKRKIKDSSRPTPVLPIWLSPDEAEFLIEIFGTLDFWHEQKLAMKESILKKIESTRGTQGIQ